MSRTGNTSDDGFVWLTFETRIEQEGNHPEGNRQGAKRAKGFAKVFGDFHAWRGLGDLGALAVFLSSFYGSH
jgi:hypothetical protein